MNEIEYMRRSLLRQFKYESESECDGQSWEFF